MTLEVKEPLTLADINRTDLSRKTGATVQHLSRVFNPNHAHRPSLELARELAKELDVSIEELATFLDGLKGPAVRRWTSPA